jgi:cell division initiation protein
VHDHDAIAPRQFGHVTARELRTPEFRRLGRGGYDADEVDAFLERVRMTMEAMARELERARLELAPLQERRSKLTSAEKDAADMLIAANRAVELIKEDAQRDARHIVAAAEENVRQAEQLRRTAEASVDGARDEARKVLADARTERERLIAEAMGDLTSVRAELKAENARLEAAVAELRTTWARRVQDAISGLERVRLSVDRH